MEKADLIKQMNEVLADEFEVEVSTITPEAKIMETLQLDSLSLVDMVALVENTFSVKIQGEEVGKILTFNDLYDYIYTRISK